MTSSYSFIYFSTTGTSDNTCDIPYSDDPQLLIDMKTDPNGTPTLIFGCRPAGEYILHNSRNPMRCEHGSWTGTLPQCNRLPRPHEIRSKHFTNLFDKYMSINQKFRPKYFTHFENSITTFSTLHLLEIAALSALNEVCTHK